MNQPDDVMDMNVFSFTKTHRFLKIARLHTYVHIYLLVGYIRKVRSEALVGAPK